jgi:hypothetical protein
MVAQPGLTTTFLTVSLCKVSLGEVQASGYRMGLSTSRHSHAEVSVQRLCVILTTFATPRPAVDGWSMESAFLENFPLSSPATATVDVVAITGLGDLAMGTFRSADGGFLWFSIEKAKHPVFARILDLLQESRGNTQSKMSETIFESIFVSGLGIPGAPSFVFNDIRQNQLDDALYDSPALLRMCTLRST